MSVFGGFYIPRAVCLHPRVAHDEKGDMQEALSVKRTHPEATLPTRAHPDDAGLDLYSLEDFLMEPGQGHTTKTGIAIALPRGFVGMVADRSSMAKRGVKSAGGIIDAGYRGEIHIVLYNIGRDTIHIHKGDRIAQLLILPMATPMPVEVDSLDETSRGAKGFGSSGR